MYSLRTRAAPGRFRSRRAFASDSITGAVIVKKIAILSLVAGPAHDFKNDEPPREASTGDLRCSGRWRQTISGKQRLCNIVIPHPMTLVESVNASSSVFRSRPVTATALLSYVVPLIHNVLLTTADRSGPVDGLLRRRSNEPDLKSARPDNPRYCHSLRVVT